MKVLALIYTDPRSWETASEAEREDVGARYRAFGDRAGECIFGGAALASPRSATTVRVRDGETFVTDGPFAETKEELGGFYLFECSGLDEAGELVAAIPGAERGAIELRAAYEEAAA
ncbi:MAG: hypothetical protein E6G50_07545 [Actinobacteria bacterium]|nr:MAG: hypothetical protein E6G50_07545 [Actinomycetota bacterium]